MLADFRCTIKKSIKWHLVQASTSCLNFFQIPKYAQFWGKKSTLCGRILCYLLKRWQLSRIKISLHAGRDNPLCIIRGLTKKFGKPRKRVGFYYTLQTTETHGFVYKIGRLPFDSQMKLDEISLCKILQATAAPRLYLYFQTAQKCTQQSRLELKNWRPFDNFYGFPKDAFVTLIF